MRMLITKGQWLRASLVEWTRIGATEQGDLRRRVASGSLTKLISVHLPKAAGTSLVKVYETAFGGERVLPDYDTSDPMDPCGVMYLDPDRYEMMKPTTLGDHVVVHGHFHIGRYDRISDAKRIVVLREPVENLISIYYYWDFLRRKARRYRGHCLYAYFCKTQPTLIEFA